MNSLLQQAIVSLNLQPGQTYRTTINGHQVEVRILKSDTSSEESSEESTTFADREMVDLWLNVPPSPTARTLTIKPGAPLLPAPLELDESDMTPE
jgi:hypothetical protein